MTDPVVTLRLNANGKGVRPGVREAQDELGKLGPTGQKVGREIEAGFKNANAQIDRTARAAQTAGGVLARFLGAAAITKALVDLSRTADAYADIDGKLRQVTTSESQLARAKSDTFAISQKYYQQLDATVTLYGRSARALADYGYGLDKVSRLTETVSAGLLVDRAGTAESASAMLQLSQALGAGALRGEEFNAMAEAAPSLMRLLAQSVGVSRGELKKMAEDGQLTIDVLVDAFTGAGAQQLAQEASKVPLTIGRAWVQARNDALVYVGSADQALGASAAIAQGIALLGRNLDVLATAATLAAVAYGAKLIQGAIQRGIAIWVAETTVVNAASVGLMGHVAATTRLTVAQTAAAVASRGLAAALAFIQANPIMLAVTAVVLLAAAAWKASQAAEEAAAQAKEMQENFVAAKDAYDAFLKAPSLDSLGDLKDADATLEQLAGHAAEAYSKLEDAQKAYANTVARFGDVDGEARKSAEAAGRAYEQAAGKLGVLIAARTEADAAAVSELQRLAQIPHASDAGREALGRLAIQMRDGTITSHDASQALANIAIQEGNAARGARIAANGFAAVRQEATDLSKVLQGMSSDLDSAIVNLVRLQKGQYQAWLVQQGQKIIANGGLEQMDPKDRQQFNETAAAYKRVLDQTEAAQAAQSAASKAATASNREAAKAARDHTKDLDQAREAQARFTAEAALAAAEQSGPLAAAQERNKQRIDELTEALAKHNITQDAFNKLKAASEAELAKQSAEFDKAINGPQALLDTMNGELSLLRQIGPQREIARRQLQAERDMREELARAVEAAGGKVQLANRLGASSYAEYESAMLAAADASAALSVAQELAAQQTEEWVSVWVRGVETAADAFTDFAMSGFRDFKKLASDLKSIAKQLVGDLIRTFLQQKIVVPIQAQITNVLGGQGSSGGGLLDGILSLFKGNGFGGAGQAGNGLSNMIGNVGGFFSKMFGGSAAASSAGGSTAWGAFGPGAAGWLGGGYGAGGVSTGAALPGLGGGAISGLSKLAGPFGALMGGLQGLSGGGDALGKLLSVGSGAAAGFLLPGALAAGSAAFAGGAGLLGSLGAGVGALGPIGIAALALPLIDSLSGGGLFGTSYKTKSSAQQFSIGDNGASGYNSVTESKKRSLFRGTKTRTTTSALDADSQSAIDELFGSVRDAMVQAAAALGVSTPALVGGTFKREFDKNGNLTREFGTIAGRVYNEAQEAFATRLQAESLLKVAGLAGNAAEIDRIAGGYRGDADKLSGFAGFMLAVQKDVKDATALWEDQGAGTLTRITHAFEDMAQSGESLADAYTRITGVANDYGKLIGGVQADLMTRGLNEYQRSALQIEQTYRDQVKQANDLAKALGLSGARSEDLAKIEELRAVNMAGLQKQMEAQRNDILAGLGLSEYSPATDAQKLTDAMQQLRDAAARGDTSAVSGLSQTALGFGRNLYASGSDYNGLYDQVTSIINGMGVPSLVGDDGTNMGDLADILLDLPNQIASALFKQAANLPSALAPPVATPGDNATLVEIRDLLRELRLDSKAGIKGREVNGLLREAGFVE